MKTVSVLAILIFLLEGAVQANVIPSSFQPEAFLSVSTGKSRDDSLVKELLFFHACSSICSDEKTHYLFVPDRGGELAFQGTEIEIKRLSWALFHKMEEGISKQLFPIEKATFLKMLEESGALFEKTIAEEIEWYHLFFEEPVTIELERSAPQKEFSNSCGDCNTFYSEDLFHNLRLTKEDKKNIEKFVKDFADLNIFELLLKKKEMENLVQKMDPIHPLRFIAYIQSCEELRQCLCKIRENYLKWKAFVGDFSERMLIELSKDNIFPYLPGFAIVTGLDVDKVEALILRGNWEGLLTSLIPLDPHLGY